MTRHGMTLLEVVLATALLALAASGIAATMAGVARPDSATRGIQAAREIAAVARLADTVLSNPAIYGFEPRAIAERGGGAIRIERGVRDLALDVTFIERSGRGGWFGFAHDDRSVARWVRLPETQP